MIGAMPAKASAKSSASGPVPRVKRETPAGSLSSVTSALRLLRVFSAEEQELGISALAKELGVAKSTAHRLAVTLAAEGFLEQNADNGRYYLGLALFELAALVRKRMDVSTLGRPLLEALRDNTQESIHMAVLAQSDILYLYNLESSQAVHARTYWGMRKPAFCTSEGRVLLAFGPPEQAAAVVKEGGDKRTPNTVVDAKVLAQMLTEVRKNGYALDNEESEIGMRGLAAPVRDVSGRVIAAVGLSAPMQRMTKRELRSLVPQVVATANGISARMGYREQ
jgi:DNA-binding IclR family transcriptional regulator